MSGFVMEFGLSYIIPGGCEGWLEIKRKVDADAEDYPLPLGGVMELGGAMISEVVQILEEQVGGSDDSIDALPMMATYYNGVSTEAALGDEVSLSECVEYMSANLRVFGELLCATEAGRRIE